METRRKYFIQLRGDHDIEVVSVDNFEDYSPETSLTLSQSVTKLIYQRFEKNLSIYVKVQR